MHLAGECGGQDRKHSETRHADKPGGPVMQPKVTVPCKAAADSQTAGVIR